MGHYVDQVKNAYNTDWTAAKEALNNNVMSMYNTIKSIIEENDFPAKAEERWTPMMESIKSNAEKLNTDIETKYNEMISRAKKFDDWYEKLKTLEGDAGGNAGLQFALNKGFEPRHDARVGWLAIPENWGYEKITVYTWTAYSSITIDSDGYITINMTRRQMEIKYRYGGEAVKSWEKILATGKETIKTQEDFDKCYTGRDVIGGEIR